MSVWVWTISTSSVLDARIFYLLIYFNTLNIHSSHLLHIIHNKTSIKKKTTKVDSIYNCQACDTFHINNWNFFYNFIQIFVWNSEWMIWWIICLCFKWFLSMSFIWKCKLKKICLWKWIVCRKKTKWLCKSILLNLVSSLCCFAQTFLVIEFSSRKIIVVKFYTIHWKKNRSLNLYYSKKYIGKCCNSLVCS